MAGQGSPFGSSSRWLGSPPVILDPQPAAVPHISPPPPRASPLGRPVAAPVAASPALPAKAPPREPGTQDFWDHPGSGSAYTPITITKTLEDSVRATEKRITDNVDNRFGQLLNCIKDLERQVVLLREDLALRDHMVTTKDQGTDPEEQPAPCGNDDRWSRSWKAQTDAGHGHQSESSWSHNAPADSTGGDQGEEAHDSWKRDTRWSSAKWHN
jgi:hypothetical protein